MDTFAKLYETHLGQILVMQDASQDDSSPEVRIYFTPENLGVCSLALKFKDSDEGWDKCEEAFNSFTEEKAISSILPTLEKLDMVWK